LDEGKNSYGFIYMSNKKQYSFDSRDFYEKCFVFYHNDCYYRYSSYVNNDTEIRPLPPKTVRGQTIYNVFKMRRNPDDERLEAEMACQCDYKIKVPDFMLNIFLPKAAKTWSGDI
jgi:hypothetical protein